MADEIIDEYGDKLESITLVRASKGRFEVSVEGNPIFSKADAHRHAEPGEVIEKLGYWLAQASVHSPASSSGQS